MEFKTDILSSVGIKEKYWEMYIDRVIDSKYIGNNIDEKNKMKYILKGVMFTSGEDWDGFHFMYNVSDPMNPGRVQFMTFQSNYDEELQKYNLFYGGIEVNFKYGDALVVTETTRSEAGGWSATSKLSFDHKPQAVTNEQAIYTYNYFKNIVLCDMKNAAEAKKKVLQEQLDE